MIILNQSQNIDYGFRFQAFSEVANNIKTGADRITTIVKSLRTFTRKDENEFQLSDIHKNIDATLVMLQNEIKNRVEIIKNYGDIPQIYCLVGQLNQVFMNLLINGLQAIEDKGVITISTKLLTKNQIQISIKDTGKGLLVENTDKIFEAFYTTKEVGKGTGLGLYISYNIIKQHQGNIRVNSEKGKGSEFIITLPVGD